MKEKIEEIQTMLAKMYVFLNDRAYIFVRPDIEVISNFIDSQEQTIKELREEIETSYNKGFNTKVDNYESKITELEKEIESLKCCGNCTQDCNDLEKGYCVDYQQLD